MHQPTGATSYSSKLRPSPPWAKSTTGRSVAYQPRTPSTPRMRCSSKTHFARNSPNCGLCLSVKATPLSRKCRRHPSSLAEDPAPARSTTSQISSITLLRPDRADCATSTIASLSRRSPVLCADASPPTPIIYASHNPGHSVAKSAMSSRCRSAACIIGRSIARLKNSTGGHGWASIQSPSQTSFGLKLIRASRSPPNTFKLTPSAPSRLRPHDIAQTNRSQSPQCRKQYRTEKRGR